jgi:hypothetical protein
VDALQWACDVMQLTLNHLLLDAAKADGVGNQLADALAMHSGWEGHATMSWLAEALVTVMNDDTLEFDEPDLVAYFARIRVERPALEPVLMRTMHAAYTDPRCQTGNRSCIWRVASITHA